MIQSMHIGDYYAYYARLLRGNAEQAVWTHYRARALAYWYAGCNNV